MRYTVPPNPMVPIEAATLCDAGADTRRALTRPAAWVPTAIQAISNAAGDGPCTPDAMGHMLHFLWELAAPGNVPGGKRRRPVDRYRPTGTAPNSPILVESDAACPWAGTFVTAYLLGGTQGDVYEVTMVEDVPRDLLDRMGDTDAARLVDVYEDPFEVVLYSYFFAAGDNPFVPFPALPAYHRWFEIVQGPAQLVGPAGLFVPLDATSPLPIVPLSAPQIQVKAGIYRTKGSV